MFRGLVFTLLVATFPSYSSLINFSITTKVDASSFGLSENEALKLEWQYDPNSLEVLRDAGDDQKIFGLSVARLTMNGESFYGNGAITIRNNHSNGVDSFQYIASSTTSSTTDYTGTINGVPVNTLNFQFIDATSSMFSDASLPSDTAFAMNSSQFMLHLTNIRTGYILERYFDGSGYTFTATVAEEPLIFPSPSEEQDGDQGGDGSSTVEVTEPSTVLLLMFIVSLFMAQRIKFSNLNS